MPMPELESEIPLPLSVRRLATEPTIVTSSPSRTHTVPSPTTISQWNRDQGSRSSRFGMLVSIVPVWTASAAALTRTLISGPLVWKTWLRVRSLRDGLLPRARPPLPLPRRGRDDGVGVRPRLRRGRAEGVRERGRRAPLRAGLRPRGPRRRRPACALHRALPATALPLAQEPLKA